MWFGGGYVVAWVFRVSFQLLSVIERSHCHLNGVYIRFSSSSCLSTSFAFVFATCPDCRILHNFGQMLSGFVGPFLYVSFIRFSSSFQVFLILDNVFYFWFRIRCRWKQFRVFHPTTHGGMGSGSHWWLLIGGITSWGFWQRVLLLQEVDEAESCQRG